MRINNTPMFNGWQDSKMQKSTFQNSDFQAALKSKAEQIQARSAAKEMKNDAVQSQDKSAAKEKILNEYPFLTEEYLDELINDYDIENMSSSELDKLAEELMDKNIIPSYPHENGLHMIAVYPKALYDKIMSGDTSVIQSGMQGVISKSPDYLYTVYKVAGREIMVNHDSDIGCNYMRYSIHLSQEAFSQYNEYYTDSERKLAQQIIKGEQAFYDLMAAVVKCKEG